MLTTNITYTCSNCSATADRGIPVGAHPYSPAALPSKWAHVPAVTGRQDDKVFCGKKACADAAAAERVKYEQDTQAMDAEAAEKFEAYVAAKVAAGQVDPRWELPPAENTAAEVMLELAQRMGVELEGRERKQLYDLWTTLTDDERAAAKAAIMSSDKKTGSKQLVDIVRTWASRP